jgi:uncharacterized membrane protein YfcA
VERKSNLLDASTILVLVGIFMIAGTVKGVIGLGLPTVSLALLTVAIDLPSAMALLLVPSLVTNLWQASIGGNARVILGRIWPFFLMAAVTVWIGATTLKRVNLSWLSALLGALLVTYSAVNLGGLRFTVESRHEVWVGILAGSVNGVLTGMTGSFMVPGVMFLQSIKLSRDALIQAMGMLFTVSTLALAAALQQNNFLTIERGTLSLAALIPAMIGVVFGQRIRKGMSEQLFRKVFFIFLLALGVYIITRSLGAFN